MEILRLILAFFGVAGFAGAAVFAGFVARGWRPPLPLALIGPALLVTIGSIAAVASGGWAEGSAGWGEAVLAAGALLAVTAALVGGAAIVGAGSPARTTAGPALLAAAFSILAAVGSAAWLLTAGASAPSFVLPLLTAVAGAGVTAAALRSGEEPDDAARGAATRFAVGTMAVGGAVVAGTGLALVAAAAVAEGLAEAEAAARIALVDLAVTDLLAAKGARMVAGLGLLAAAAAGAMPASAALPYGDGNRTALGGFGAAVVVAVAAGLGLAAWSATDEARRASYREDLAPTLAAVKGLPEGGGPLPAGDCLSLPDGDGWRTRGTCDAPLWLAPAEMPAAHLLGSEASDWIVVTRSSDEPELHHRFADVARYGSVSLRRAAGEAEVTAQPGWTIAELLEACAAAEGPCDVAPAAAPVRHEERSAAKPAEPAPPRASGDWSPTAPDAVRRTVQANQPQLRACYEGRLKVNPDLAGRVELSWVVEGGKVVRAGVASNTTRDEELASCLVARVKRWSFGPDVEGEIVWPFIFRPAPVAP